MCDLYLKEEQALGIVYTYCQKLSLLEQSFGPLEMLYCKQDDFVFLEKEVAILKKAATTEQPLLQVQFLLCLTRKWEDFAVKQEGQSWWIHTDRWARKVSSP